MKCSSCGQPAEYRHPNRDYYTVCETCAHVDHGERVGERYMAAQMVMVAAQAAHKAGLAASDLHTLVSEALQSDQDGHEFSAPDVPWLSGLDDGGRADRRWLRHLEHDDFEPDFETST